MHIQLSEDSKYWECIFEYRPDWVTAIKKIGGAKFVPKDKGGPKWRIPATVDSHLSVGEYFHAEDLQWEPSILEEIADRKRKSALLKSMSTAETAELQMLPELNPKLHAWVSTRGYQLADIAYMAAAPNPLNTNQPGTGKTVETIASIYEAGLEQGPVLVVAPATSLYSVWATEVRKWVAEDVPVVTVGQPGAARKRAINDILVTARKGDPCWVIVNPEAIKLNASGGSPFPELYKVSWNVVVLDEFHRMGLSNNKTLAYKSLKKIKADKRIALSGTPMGGAPIKLWAVLNFLYPEEFSSKWAFAGNWLTVFDNGFGKVIGDVKKHRREEFSEMMNEYSVRRLKKDIMQWLPNKQYVERWVELSGAQKKQYDEWELNGEIEIENESIDAITILAMYTRMRQFAISKQTVEVINEESFRIKPTEDSAKLPALWEILADRGIGDGSGPAGDPVIVFSQFTQVIDMVEAWLRKKGVPTRKITGHVTGPERATAIEEFQSGAVDVMLMNTNAGGVAITLDRSNTVVFLDETWNPDDQEQAEDRAHRGNKTSQVIVYKILAKDTVDERIHSGNLSKESINQRVLDHRHNS